jgi:DNA-binding winged helix-turn-helix (wHTH) protein
MECENYEQTDLTEGHLKTAFMDRDTMKSFESFLLDDVNQCLWRGEVRVSLTPKPFAVLRHLVEQAGRLVINNSQ